MGVLIRDMEMPKGCASCFLKYGSCASIRKRMDVSKGDRWCPENYRHPDCPIIEVPLHGRLIEAEPIMKFITDGLNSGEFGYDQIKVLTEIQYAPTVIPADKDGET